MPARQASCVLIGRRAVLIEGPPGCGKSSLALGLIDRGATLIGDDSVIVERRGEHLMARPHPETPGLIEVRNLGLLTFPLASEARVAILLVLDEAAPRYIEKAETAVVEGLALPMLRLWPGSPVQPLKAELALRNYGLEW